MIFPKGAKDEDKCDKEMNTSFRPLLGSINWLQSRTQFQACYQFSRSASASAGPTIGDCKALNKLCKQIVTDPMELRFWPLEGRPHWIAMPDAAFRSNSDKSSQRAMATFMGEQRKHKQKNTRGFLISLNLQRSRNNPVHNCCRVVCIYEVLWHLPDAKRRSRTSQVAQQTFTCALMQTTL